MSNQCTCNKLKLTCQTRMRILKNHNGKDAISWELTKRGVVEHGNTEEKSRSQR